MAAFFLLRQNAVGQPTTVNDFLSPAECRSAVDGGERSLTLREGKTEDHKIHEQLRKSQIGWFDPDGDCRWLFQKIADCITQINSAWFGYNLLGFEGIQFTKYAFNKNQSGDFYSSHQDTALLPGGTIRKLSFTVQLSDPTSYDGGDVILYKSFTDFVTLNRATGSITFFPSYMIHEVTPVTKGTRYSLVGWACGPAFV
jgi:PKHD-type hydroxylase